MGPQPRLGHQEVKNPLVLEFEPSPLLAHLTEALRWPGSSCMRPQVWVRSGTKGGCRSLCHSRRSSLHAVSFPHDEPVTRPTWTLLRQSGGARPSFPLAHAPGLTGALLQDLVVRPLLECALQLLGLNTQAFGPGLT